MGPNKYWSQHLSTVLEIYNNLQHSSTKFSPNTIENGTLQDLNDPIARALNSEKELPTKEEIWNAARRNNLKAIVFQPGDIVLVKSERKRSKETPLYAYRAKVIERTLNNFYRLDLPVTAFGQPVTSENFNKRHQ